MAVCNGATFTARKITTPIGSRTLDRYDKQAGA